MIMIIMMIADDDTNDDTNDDTDDESSDEDKQNKQIYIINKEFLT